jgi:hypothetical protein
VVIQRGEHFYNQLVEVGPQNEEDIIVLKGVKEGDMVALVDPAEAAKKAKNKL